MWKRYFAGRRKSAEIQPDEIFIDSHNPAEYDTELFEGRFERPLPYALFIVTGRILTLILLALLVRAVDLQFMRGETFAQQALHNQLSETIVFAERGNLVDRAGERLAWNENVPGQDFSRRAYTERHGLAHVIGYTKAPTKDSAGFYYRLSHEGVDGAERVFNAILAGKNGTELVETNALGETVARVRMRQPHHGERLSLSVDADVSEAFYVALERRAREAHYYGGAGVIMDVHTGELIALVSYPEFSPRSLTEGNTETIKALREDPRRPFLNRVAGGLYTPGSIVKPFIAVAALTEGIIDENKKILSTGSLVVPNPYFPDQPSVFRDWRAHGWTDMREAIAVSSDVYFYTVGGGFEGERGLGIGLLERYYRLFGFGASAGLTGFPSPEGVVPSPSWKEATFDGDPWRVGDTYNTAIGQYGVLVTPLQAVRATAALANGGLLLTPTLLAGASSQGVALPVDSHALQVAREGMRLAVTAGTAVALNTPAVSVAAKTGTAQVGARNELMNSWVIGFFPYENPKYAFAAVLERAPAKTLVGAPAVVRELLDWMRGNAPEYLK